MSTVDPHYKSNSNLLGTRKISIIFVNVSNDDVTNHSQVPEYFKSLQTFKCAKIYLCLVNSVLGLCE